MMSFVLSIPILLSNSSPFYLKAIDYNGTSNDEILANGFNGRNTERTSVLVSLHYASVINFN